MTGEVEKLLLDPVAVHVNMLRGTIAKPSIENIIHLYGRDALLAALRAQDREGAREMLRWEVRDGGWWAHSANLHVGFVVRRATEGGGFEWAYSITAVFTKWITKGHGETKSERTAKAAVERAWAAWLEHAGLGALPLSPVRTEDGHAKND